MERKGQAGMAALARVPGRPAIAFADSVEERPSLDAHFKAIVPVIDRAVSLEEAMQNAAPFLQRAAARAARFVRLPTIL